MNSISTNNSSLHLNVTGALCIEIDNLFYKHFKMIIIGIVI